MACWMKPLWCNVKTTWRLSKIKKRWFVVKRFLWDTFYLPSFVTCHINDCVCHYNVARCLNCYSCFLIFSKIRFLIALWRYWLVTTRILCRGKGCYDLHLKWLQRNTLYYYQKTVPFYVILYLSFPKSGNSTWNRHKRNSNIFPSSA